MLIICDQTLFMNFCKQPWSKWFTIIHYKKFKIFQNNFKHLSWTFANNHWFSLNVIASFELFNCFCDDEGWNLWNDLFKNISTCSLNRIKFWYILTLSSLGSGPAIRMIILHKKDHTNDNFVWFCIKKTVWMIILFNFASKRPYEWYIWLKFSPKIALFPCYVFWFVFISAAIKWGTVMIGQSRDFSCLLTNFPGRIKKKHCARRKHSKITKEGRI